MHAEFKYDKILVPYNQTRHAHSESLLIWTLPVPLMTPQRPCIQPYIALFLAFFFILGVIFPVAAESIQDAAIWANKGKALAEIKDYQGAIGAYDQALQLDAYYAEAWKLRGDTLITLERYIEAADSYDRAIAIDKINAEIIGKKARTQYLLGRYRDSLETYDRAVSLNPNIFQNLDGKGDVLAALNRFSEADAAYDAALKLRPDSNSTWNKKGLSLARTFRNEEAADAFNRSIAIYPGSAEVWNNRGSVLFNLGRMQEALEAFEHAISLDQSYIPQKYEDTLSRLQADQQAQTGKPGPVSTQGVTAALDLKIPPTIFIMNYLMIGLGLLAILMLGMIRVIHARKKAKNLRVSGIK